MSNQVGGAILDMVLGALGVDGTAAGLVLPYGPGAVATLVLDLENGYSVKHSWITDIAKFRAGNEQRRSRNDTDRESFSGSAYLVGDRPREIRALLARYAAIGSVFLLALPHEAITARSDGTTIHVPAAALALCDWAVPGQRVVFVYLNDDGESVGIDAVVQTAAGSAITLDVSAGEHIGEIMPTRHVYLEPQQDFGRSESDVESWNLNARYATPLDFAPTLASLDLGDVFVSLAGNVVTSRVFGLLGETAFRLFVSPAYPATGALVETSTITTVYAKTNVTTMGDVETLLASSALAVLTEVNAGYVIQSADAFSGSLGGATDHGSVGAGVTVETYVSHPVWDREINVEGAVTDGVQAMTQILDHGGLPYALGTADQADWARAVVLSDADQTDWQWFKLFMSTVVGKQKKFWLATWRDDLEYVSHSGTSLVIDSIAGDFTAWWPRQRQHVQVLQADNTVTYVEVTAAVDNLDGTRTLTLSASLSGSAVERISWLELCRFESADSYETRHGANGFSVGLLARVVP